jgi:mono/diheme cytochrome c family protein
MPHPSGSKAVRALAFTSLLSVFATGMTMAADDEAMKLGKQVFTETAAPQCSICHRLDNAGAEGEVGPDLDDMKPTEESVRLAVTGGVGAMPAYGKKLTSEEIDAVALYVSTAAGGGE